MDSKETVETTEYAKPDFIMTAIFNQLVKEEGANEISNEELVGLSHRLKKAVEAALTNRINPTYQDGLRRAIDIAEKVDRELGLHDVDGHYVFTQLEEESDKYIPKESSFPQTVSIKIEIIGLGDGPGIENSAGYAQGDDIGELLYSTRNAIELMLEDVAESDDKPSTTQPEFPTPGDLINRLYARVAKFVGAKESDGYARRIAAVHELMRYFWISKIPELPLDKHSEFIEGLEELERKYCPTGKGGA